MKLYRFMSESEYQALMSGETIHSRPDSKDPEQLPPDTTAIQEDKIDFYPEKIKNPVHGTKKAGQYTKEFFSPMDVYMQGIDDESYAMVDHTESAVMVEFEVPDKQAEIMIKLSKQQPYKPSDFDIDFWPADSLEDSAISKSAIDTTQYDVAQMTPTRVAELPDIDQFYRDDERYDRASYWTKHAEWKEVDAQPAKQKLLEKELNTVQQNYELAAKDDPGDPRLKPFEAFINAVKTAREQQADIDTTIQQARDAFVQAFNDMSTGEEIKPKDNALEADNSEPPSPAQSNRRVDGMTLSGETTPSLSTDNIQRNAGRSAGSPTGGASGASSGRSAGSPTPGAGGRSTGDMGLSNSQSDTTGPKFDR